MFNCLKISQKIMFNGSFHWTIIVASSIAGWKSEERENKANRKSTVLFLSCIIAKLSHKVFKSKTEDNKWYTSRKHHKEQDKWNWKSIFQTICKDLLSGD